MTRTRKPTDKLDAATSRQTGPEDDILDLRAVDWRACEERTAFAAAIFTACLSRMRGNPTSGLRGAGRSNAPGLPGPRGCGPDTGADARLLEAMWESEGSAERQQCRRGTRMARPDAKPGHHDVHAARRRLGEGTISLHARRLDGFPNSAILNSVILVTFSRRFPHKVGVFGGIWGQWIAWQRRHL